MCSILEDTPKQIVRTLARFTGVLASMSPDGSNVFDQQAVVTGLTGLIERLSAVRALWLTAVAADGSFTLDGHRNAGAWLSSETGLSPGDAGWAVRQAETAAKMPEVRDAWAAGEITGSSVSLLGTVVDQPGFTDAADELLDTARTTPRALGKTVSDFEREQRSRESLDERNRRQRDRRSLTRTADGMTRLDGLLHPEAAASLRTSLETLMTPDPEGSGIVRTHPQRQADALVELCKRGAARPDAPVDARPRIIILTPYDAFITGSTTSAHTTWGDPISGEDLRRLSCDAIIDRVTIDGDGLPLDVGRSVYTPPAHIRRAVIARDQGCIWPGCTVPAHHCDVHHTTPWEEFGPTSLGNLALCCDGHHHVVHQPGWKVRFVDGRPRIFTPNGHMLPANHDRLTTRPNQRTRPPGSPPPGSGLFSAEDVSPTASDPVLHPDDRPHTDHRPRRHHGRDCGVEPCHPAASAEAAGSSQSSVDQPLSLFAGS